MRLFAITALVLAPAAAFAQTNQTTLEARLKAPAALTTTATEAATPGVAVAALPAYHDVIKASLVAPELDKAAAQGGVIAYTWNGDANAKPEFAAPKLVSVVGRKLPLSQVASTNADVVVNFIVDNHGVPAEVKVVRSAGSAAVDASTVEAVKQYRFQPATYNNLPVYSHVAMEISVKK